MTEKPLTPQRLNAEKPGATARKIFDPACPGLYCTIYPQRATKKDPAKTFAFAFNFEGKRCEVVIGKYPGVTLNEARERAIAHRRTVERGEDPRAAKRVAKAEKKAKNAPPDDSRVFRVFAAKWQKLQGVDWSPSYAAQIDSRLERFIFPVIGDMSISEVRPIHVLKIFEPLQEETPGTAEGVRKIIEAIYKYAIQLDAAREGAADRIEQNPAFPYRGFIKVPKSKGAPHLSPKEVGAFWLALGRQGAHASTIAATKLLFLTMTRKSEVLRAKWYEFNLDEAIWEIPKERMKADEAHRVYLSRQAVELLTVQKAVTGKLPYVFPSAFRDNVPMAECTLNHLFKRIDVRADFSPHGSRATATSWLRDLKVSSQCVELLCAHAIPGVAGKYQRQELKEERIAALQLLADSIDKQAAKALAEEAKAA